MNGLDIQNKSIHSNIKKLINPKSWGVNLHQSDYILFTDRNELVKVETGFYVDKVSQNIINTLGKKLLIVVNSLSGFNGNIKNNTNYLDSSYFHFKRRLKQANPRPTIKGKEKLIHILSDDDLSLGDYQFEEDIHLFFIYHSIFDTWLDNVKPKIVFINCGYSLFHQALIYSCNIKNIKTVELQHGLISEGHIQYSVATDIGKETFPQYLLTFSNYHSKFINENFINRSNIYPIGHYYREQKVKEKSKDCERMVAGLRKKYQKIILVASQNIIEKDLCDCVKYLAEKQPNYGFIFKQRNLSSLNFNSENIIIDTKHNIYDFINLVDVNLSCFSTSVLEFVSNKTIGVLMDFSNLASNYYGTIKEDCDNIFICKNNQAALDILNKKTSVYKNPEFYTENNKQHVESLLLNSLK